MNFVSFMQNRRDGYKNRIKIVPRKKVCNAPGLIFYVFQCG